MGAEMAAALRVQFPDRSFTLVYVEEQVAFCQTAPDVPRGIVVEEHRVFDLRLPASETAKCWCPHCDGPAPFTVRAVRDAEFAFAQFGDCDRCGGEVLLWTDREYIPV